MAYAILESSNCSDVSEACDSTQSLPFSFCQDAIGVVCHQFGLLSTNLHVLSWADYCRDFELGLLVPALPQLERLCHRLTADWYYAIFSSYSSRPIREKC